MSHDFQRAPRVSPEKTAQIVRLALRQVPHTEIAQRVKVNRHTVKKVLDRTRTALAITTDLAQERAEAMAVYREVQRSAWEAIESGRSPAMLLAEVRQAQQRIDALLGLPSGPDDPAFDLERFKSIVVNLIHQHAPEVGPLLAERLREIEKQAQVAPVHFYLPQKDPAPDLGEPPQDQESSR